MKAWQPPISEPVFRLISSTPPSEWCQAFFVLLSCGVLAVAVTPASARRRLLDYGARTSNGEPGRDGHHGDDWFSSLVSTLTSWGQVPHSWFMGFYTTSLACSLFWLAQYLGHGRIMGFIATKQAAAPGPSMMPGQVVIVWMMMVLQASRRIYEHLTFIKPSKSKMWCVHWLLGLSYYLCMSLALWVEGAESILDRSLTTLGAEAYSLKTIAGMLIYLFAWLNQYQCHKHLAGLKKYSLPESGMFGYLVSPHYTCECLLYLAMAVAGAPRDTLCNKTLMCGLMFVVVNLGVTAAGTRKWYIEKFGADAVKKRWNMIPFVF